MNVLAKSPRNRTTVLLYAPRPKIAQHALTKPSCPTGFTVLPNGCVYFCTLPKKICPISPSSGQRQSKIRQNKTRRNKTRQGEEKQHEAAQGKARKSKARARRSKAKKRHTQDRRETKAILTSGLSTRRPAPVLTATSLSGPGSGAHVLGTSSLKTFVIAIWFEDRICRAMSKIDETARWGNKREI